MSNLLLDILRATKPGRAVNAVQQQDALRNLASQMSGVPTDGTYGPVKPINKQTALARYGEITGDLSPVLGIGEDNLPSDVQSYKFFSQLNTKDPKVQEALKLFQGIKRAPTIINNGGENYAYDPLNPAMPLASFKKTPPPQDMPEFRGRQEEARQNAILQNAARIASERASGGASGEATGQAQGQLDALQSGLPSLQDSIKRASALANDATYTKGGGLYDLIEKEVFGKTTKGALAKTGFESIINNEVVPQLKQMLGTQFTEKDREFATKTMSDVNSTPEEKQVQLQTYLKQRINNIASLKRRVGQQDDGTSADQSVFDGVQPNNPPNLPAGNNSGWGIRRIK